MRNLKHAVFKRLFLSQHSQKNMLFPNPLQTQQLKWVPWPSTTRSTQANNIN